jgi:hypothetical protein
MSTLVGILLALACALSTNVGFLYKHRGACAAASVDIRRPLRTGRALFASPLFAIGMAIGLAAWLFHVAAMSLAPLSIVQAVLAGGIAFLAVVAEQLFGMRVSRRQWIALGAMACGLTLLAVTLPAPHGASSRFSVGGMLAFEGGLTAAAMLLIVGPSIGTRREHHGLMLGAAAGLLFGASDVGIKAISGRVGPDGLLGAMTPWALMCMASSIAAFYSSAKAFQVGDAVPVITVTGAAANVSGIVGGFVVFGDPLSADPVGQMLECVAFALVLLAAWLMPVPVRAAAVPA